MNSALQAALDTVSKKASVFSEMLPRYPVARSKGSLELDTVAQFVIGGARNANSFQIHSLDSSGYFFVSNLSKKLAARLYDWWLETGTGDGCCTLYECNSIVNNFICGEKYL